MDMKQTQLGRFGLEKRPELDTFPGKTDEKPTSNKILMQIMTESDIQSVIV